MITQEVLELIANALDDTNRLIECEKDGVRFAALKSVLFTRIEINEDDNELSAAVEYRLTKAAEVPVHRSAVVHMKQPMVFAESQVGSIGQ